MMLRQIQSPALRLKPSAHLTQTMGLLELNIEALRQKIERELSSNPALELLKHPRCPGCQRVLPPSGICPVCSATPSQDTPEAIVFVSPQRDLNYSITKGAFSEDEEPPAEYTPEEEDLATYILRQIAPELERDDRPIAAHILANLDEDGLLHTPLLEIAQYHHISLARVQKVLRLIQHADPLGVGSSSPKEALCIQLEALEEIQPVPQKAHEIIEHGLDLLGRHAYGELAKMLHISIEEVSLCAQFITNNLNPYPGRAFWGEVYQRPSPSQAYAVPDIIITKLNDHPTSPLVVEIISPYAGYLRINPKFRQALSEIPPGKIEDWKSDLENAQLLLKCLQQRNTALIRLMQKLVAIQRRYILEGDAYLVPITRAQLAVELGVHESTISRAVSDKAVQLPNKRIVPLARWFDRSLPVRTEIIQIIREEREPLSDAQIAEILEKRGYFIARRTVAKYRSLEGILPAKLRKSNVSVYME